MIVAKHPSYQGNCPQLIEFPYYLCGSHSSAESNDRGLFAKQHAYKVGLTNAYIVLLPDLPGVSRVLQCTKE